MPKFSTKFSEYFELPNPNLRAYFGRVRRGQPDEYRTPFYKGKALSSILNDWMKILRSSDLASKWPSLMDFELDLAKKVGPLSIMKPLDERMDDIDHYYSGVVSPGEPIQRAAMDAVVQEWRKASGLRLRSYEATLKEMKLNTNSGSPLFRKRKDVIQLTYPISDLGISGDDVVAVIHGKLWKLCATMGWRGQEGGPSLDDVKQRLVWMFPFAVNWEELRFYQPFKVAMQTANYVPAWVSLDAVDERVTQLFDTKGKHDLVVCTDFTKFDQHFNVNLQDAARYILSRLSTKDKAMVRWFNEVFPIKYTIPLCYDYGSIRKGKHGMGSGSGGTNDDETTTHRALQYEAAMNDNSQLNPNSQCLGDDGILSYPGITVESVVRSYTAHGLEMNLDKQEASTTYCVYLRRWHHVDYRDHGICVGVYSTCRALGRLAEQERYYDPEVWGPKAVALRYLAIIENCKWHPLREKFADYCMKGDKYRLGLDIPGFLDHIQDEARKLVDYMPDFLGYTKSLGMKDPTKGIESWWIIQYLKSKR